MKNQIKILLFFSVFGFNACSVYIPNAINTPMFSKKGEATVNANIGTGVNLQLAYAATNHIGILANGFFNNKVEILNNNDTRKGSGKLYEAGIGYFHKSERNFAFETFIGGGGGSVNINKKVLSPVSNKDFESTAIKFFLQPTIGYTVKHFEIGFTPRFTMLKYSKPTTTYSIAELTADNFLNLEKTNWMFLEPTITIRAGGERLKGQLQIGNAFKLNSELIGFTNGIINIGITYKFAHLKNRI